MAEDGALDGVDACLRMSGVMFQLIISAAMQELNGVARMFEIDVQGNPGHGAQPILAVDAIRLALQLFEVSLHSSFQETRSC